MLIALGRHRQHPLNQGAVLWVLQGCVSEERVNRCQAGVPASDRIVAVPFKMIEESAHKRCVQVLQPEFRWCLPKALLCEYKKQSERVTVTANRLRAGASLRHQAFHKEPLHQSCEVTTGHHDETPFLDRGALPRVVKAPVRH